MLLRIGILTLSSKVQVECMFSIMKLQENINIHNIQIELDFGSSKSKLLKNFYKSKAEYLLFINENLSNFEKYIEILIKKIEKASIYSIIGINFRVRKYDLSRLDYINNNVFHGELIDSVHNTLFLSKNGVIRMKYINSGLMLISRPVIQGLLRKYPSYKTSFHFFESCIDNYNNYLSGDMVFCNYIRSLGGDILLYMNSNLKCHLDHIYFNGSYKDYLVKLINFKNNNL